MDFPGGTVGENLPAIAGDTSLIPGLGGSHMPRGNQAHGVTTTEAHAPRACAKQQRLTAVRSLRTTIRE